MTSPYRSGLLACILCSLQAAFGQGLGANVCDVLGAGPTDGQRITVQGEILGSARHGFMVGETSSSEPCPGWRQRFLTAPSVIPLNFTGGPGAELTKEQKQFNLDFLARLIALERDKRLTHFRVSASGVIARKSNSFIFRRSDGSYFGNAVGQDGGFLAILLVTSIHEIGK